MVREYIDTIDALMARYVAGTLPLPARVLVESHLEMRPSARALVADLEAMAGAVLADGEAAGLSDREAMLDNIFSSPAPDDPEIRFARPTRAEKTMPAALRDFIGFDLESVPWRTRMPGFREYRAGEVEGCEVNLYWIRPGRAVPAHTHHGCELTLVLRGAFSDGMSRYGSGDIAVADDDIDHRPVAEPGDPCICFAVTDAPLRLTGSFRQLIGDLIG